MRLSRLRFAIAGCACLVAVLASTTGGGFVQMVVAGLGAIRSEVTEVQFDVAMVRRGSSDPRFQSLVDRVRQEPGIVLADPPDVLVLANRPIYLEPLIFTILQDEGRWRGDEVVHAICEGDVHLLVLAYPLEAGSIGFGRFGPWPPAVLAALRSRMQLDQVVAGRSVYTPRTPTPVDGC